ncbi:MAG: type IV pilus twitching motility protein PilT [Armatimonadota bacterium]
MKSIHDLLEDAIQVRASDLIVKAGSPPIVRVNGRIQLLDMPPVTAAEAEELGMSVRLSAARDRILRYGSDGLPEEEPAVFGRESLLDEQDLVFTIPDLVRVRGSVYLQHGTVAVALRIIPLHPYTIDELELPPVLKTLCSLRSGLILVTGPTGCGKSTTLAAMIEQINRERQANIITIEDPIEYVFEDKQAVIQQREVGKDTRSFAAALTAVMRQSPDVIMVGEMRDLDAMEATLAAAEVGHLVMSTLHTTSAPAAVDRIVNAFPPYHKPKIVTQLANSLAGVIAQRLVNRADGSGRIAAVEVMTGSPTVCKLIEEGNTGDLPATIREGSHYGMVTMNQSLVQLVGSGTITIEEALENSPNTTELRQLLRQAGAFT